MKKKLIVFLSLSLLLGSIFAINAFAYNSYSTNLYKSGFRVDYVQQTVIDTPNGYTNVAVNNRVYINGSLFDGWTNGGTVPGSYGASKSYNLDASYIDSNITAYTDRTLFKPGDRTGLPLLMTSDNLTF